MYKIKNAHFRNGGEVQLGQLVVIVGPNNAGKSQFLRDLTLCASGQAARAKILSEVEVELDKSATDFIRERADSLRIAQNGQRYLDGAGISLDENSSIQYNWASLSYHTQDETTALTHLADSFARSILAYLTTEARLTFSKHRTNLFRPNSPGASSLVEALFDGSPADEQWISERTHRAFGLSIALDSYSSPGALEIRVAPSFSALARGNRQKAREFLKDCDRLDDQGDGLRSFVATLGAIKTLQREVFLVDEPEAFLHPPQAFQIGRTIAQSIADGKQTICATHSADFLRGIISETNNLTIIRINRDEKGQSVKILSPEDLLATANDPLLSSGRVLDGIFYRNVIITESDGDAVTYEKITSDQDASGEIYYVNSYSKQATSAVVTPFKSMGVPCAAIIDLDLIRIGPEFSRVAEAFLSDPNEACNLADGIRSHIEQTPTEDFLKEALEQIRGLPKKLEDVALPDSAKQLEWLRARLSDVRNQASPWSDIKRHGIHSTVLNDSQRSDLEKLLGILDAAGLFLVPVGERESWLEPEVPYSKNKSAFTKAAIEYLSTNSLSEAAPLKKFARRVADFFL